MPERRMLRDMMSVNDIYSFADSIIELLREEYGTYDADTLDEVQVEDRFAQRLKARGYEVRSANDPAPTPVPTPAPVAPAPIGIPQETPVVPVTVVRTRRTTGSAPSGATRTRRATPSSDGSRSTPSDGNRSTPAPESRRAAAESPRPAPEASADTGGDSAASPEARPTRTRRTTTRTRSSNNGEAGS